ncbi:MAG: MFS transporter [Neisseriaceae bacterium]|nr:MAG: MFS transporter [Neisseriaceae bacterium]
MINKTSLRKFAFFFVLYELTTYLSNDMIMPAMLQVVNEFNAPISKMILALTYFVIGGSLLQMFLGPLAERYGKKLVLLSGNVFFLITTLAILFSTTIDYFLLSRFFQGMGICFIFIGYAAIHESSDAVEAVKITSLLANIAIFAPLAGPVLGSALAKIFHWQAVFIFTLLLGLTALFGLCLYMPNQVAEVKSAVNLKKTISSYKNILRSRVFMLGIFIAGITIVPLTGWIGLSPVILMQTMHQSYAVYIGFQIIIFSGFIISSFMIQKIAGRISFKKIIRCGNILALIGIVGAAIFCANPNVFIAFMFVYALGYGLFNGSVIRIALMSTGESSGLSSACMSLLYCIYISLGLEIYNVLGSHFQFTLSSYAYINVLLGVIAFICLLRFAKCTEVSET